MNLLEETILALKEEGLTPENVLFILDFSTNGAIKWEDFVKKANFDYEDGFGTAEINSCLCIVGLDWWMVREEYDGSEWWQYCKMPKLSDFSLQKEVFIQSDYIRKKQPTLSSELYLH